MGIQVKTERVPAAEANQRFERQIMQQGGVSFDLTERLEDALPVSSDTPSSKHVALLLQPERIITGTETGLPGVGKKADRARLLGQLDDSRPDAASGRVAVTMTTDQRFNGASYDMNLQDAPAELQAAVDKAWDNLQVNEAALQGDLPAELVAQRKLLEPIIRARLAEVALPQAVELPEPAAASAPSREPYDPKRLQGQPDAGDAAVMDAYKDKGWNKLGKHGRADYQARRDRLKGNDAQAPQSEEEAAK